MATKRTLAQAIFRDGHSVLILNCLRLGNTEAAEALEIRRVNETADGSSELTAAEQDEFRRLQHDPAFLEFFHSRFSEFVK